MQLLTLNERSLVAGGLRLGSASGSTSTKVNPDLLMPPSGYGGGGGFGYGYSQFTGGSYGQAGYFSGNADPFSASASDMTVTFTNDNGSSFTQTGNHPDRDNNPLDVQYGNFAIEHGAIGNDTGGGINNAIFPTAQDGWTAAMDLVGQDGYGHDMTLDQIISTLSPASDNNPTASMEQWIPHDAGVLGSEAWDVLSTASQAAFLTQYGRYEGFPIATRGGYK